MLLPGNGVHCELLECCVWLWLYAPARRLLGCLLLCSGYAGQCLLAALLLTWSAVN
jgi:hypothetical protein